MSGLPESKRGWDQEPGEGQPILLVEGDDAMREVFADTLTALGYRICAVADGYEAAALAQGANGKRFDLVICDMVMPGLNALELYEALQLGRYEGKMLIITGYPMPHTGASLVARPGVQWARRPIGLDELQALIDQMLQG